MRKKVIALLCMLFMFSALNTGVIFGQEISDPYEQCLLRLNAEYNLNLGYVKVNSQEISLEDYTEMATELAKEQRKTLDYIEMRKNSEIKNIALNVLSPISTYASSYTISDTKSYSTWAEISATYTCYPGSPNRVGNPRNVEGRATNAYTSNSGVWYVQEDWDYDVIDAGETLAITTTGYTETYFGLGKIENVIIYGEFYFE